ncbi:MAG: hypothetical protein QME96_14970, partial [Myxococcota bacterium]|nr:hypothetical protein [Myxococcota bacterium]
PAAAPSLPAAPARAAGTGDMLRELDRSVGKLAGGLGGLVGASAKRPAEHSEPGAAGSTAPAGADATAEAPPIQRVQVHLDLAALKTLTLWNLLKMVLDAEVDQTSDEACVLEILDKTNSVFLDVSLRPDGEPGAMLVALRSPGGPSLADCISRNLDEGESLTVARIGGVAGHRLAGPGAANFPAPVVLVQASPGTWLLGTQPQVEATLAAGGNPEHDGTFQTLAGPVGPADFRLAVVPSPAMAAMAPSADDAPPAMACLASLPRTLRGAGLGLRITDGFNLAVALQAASAAEAAQTQGCLQGAWNVLKPMALAGMDEEEAAEFQQMLGISLAQILDSVSFEAAGNFTKVSLSLPASVLENLSQLAAGLAGEM